MKERSSGALRACSMSLNKIPLVPGGILGILYLTLLLAWNPSQGVEQFRDRSYSLRITDREGRLLYITPLEEGLRREFTPLSDLPPDLVKLMIQAEDSRFYLHVGVDPLSLIRAVFQYAREGEVVSGGSTITMQLARIINPRPATAKGKIREMVQAVWLEIGFSKKEILEMWLNNLPYGRNTEGVSSAARFYFGREPFLLTRGEMGVLAVLPRSPSLYDPRGGYGTVLVNRVVSLLGKTDLLEKAGVESLQREINEGSLRGERYVFPSLAPHYIRALIPHIDSDYLTGKKGGGTFTSSLNLVMQEQLEMNLNHLISEAREYRIHNGAALVLDNKSGEILAYVGSQDFTHGLEGQIDGVRAMGQPGSTMKPFLYALALEKGMTPATILPDIPLLFGKGEVYRPENFNNRYNGPVRLRTALASSLNIPAVFTLERVGTSAFIEKLKELGFDSLIGREENLGTGLALGNGDVTLFELTTAFSLFARRGNTLVPRWGQNDSYQPGEAVYSERSAALVGDILSDSAGRVTGFGQSSRLDTSFPAIFKTGTSNQFNDIWALGSTTDLTCGVWMGNFSGETVIGRPGSSLPAQVVVDFLKEFTQGTPFTPIPGVKKEMICSLSGERAGPYCPGVLEEIIPEEAILEECTYHRHEDGRVSWPVEYLHWLDGSREGLTSTAINDLFAANKERPLLLHPPGGSIFYIDPALPFSSQQIRIEVQSPVIFSLMIDGNIIMADQKDHLIYHHPLEKGEHKITLIGGNQKFESIYFVK
jgi:penicillin-binding protein 1C